MRGLVLLAPLALAACVDQARMDGVAFQRQFTLAENYQAVYARTNSQMRECYSGGGGLGPVLSVDGQLYPDLGYGEIQSGISSITYMPTTLVRIDREGAGARVSMKTSAYANIETTLAWLEYFARGGQRCPVFTEAPPPL